MAKKEDKSGYKVEIGEDLFDQALASVSKHEKSRQPADEEKEDAVEIEVEGAPEKETATDSDTGSLETKGKKYDALYERFVRAHADFDNFRKRHSREKLDWQRYGAESFLHKILPIIDNLERAVAQTPQNEASESILQGLKMVLSELDRAFKEQGITTIIPMSEAFDPLLHEAVETKFVAGVDPGKVVEVHLKGYKLLDRLIRPARVTVSAESGQQNVEENEES